MSNILLLEDDLSLINGLSFAFKKQGFELNIARTLKEAEELWTDGKYDLLVLDVSLPDGSGFEFCKRVRLTSKVPIIFLTASDEETSIIMGLHLSEDETIDLLKSAGYAFSDGSKRDWIVRYCLEQKIYNINQVNTLLFEYDQEQLGA